MGFLILNIFIVVIVTVWVYNEFWNAVDAFDESVLVAIVFVLSNIVFSVIAFFVIPYHSAHLGVSVISGAVCTYLLFFFI